MVPGSGETPMLTATSAVPIPAAPIVVVRNAWLSSGARSSVVLDTSAELITAPSTVGMMPIVTVALEPLGTVPSEHVTISVPLQLPWLALTGPGVTAAGSVSTSVTSAAAAGPAFATVIE